MEAKRPEGTPPEGAAVNLELTIGADGKLTDAKVVGAASEELDAAALEAVRQFTFEPARKGDRAVPARIRYRYTFETGLAAAPASATAPARGAPPPPRRRGAPRHGAGRLEGRILSRAGDKPVAAATVTLLSDAGAAVGTTLAAEDGAFAFADVAPRVVPRAHRGRRLRPRRGDEAVTSGEATAITYRLEAAKKKTDNEYAFGATASIAAPPREVTKRTLAPEELVRAAGTRGDPLRVIELLPGVARPPGLAGFIIIRGASPVDSQALFEGGAGRPHLPLRRPDQLRQPAPARAASTSTPATSRRATAARWAASSTSACAIPQTDGFHGMADINLVDAVAAGRGSAGQDAARSPSPAKRSYIDFWFNERRSPRTPSASRRRRSTGTTRRSHLQAESGGNGCAPWSTARATTSS